jgi:DNA-binding transcriptional LysR family regulator
MDRLKCMSVFVQVVDAGSFAAVADPSGMTAAMVGRHVRTLEDLLGTQLLNRTTRRHSLTEAGRIYYERSKGILADLEAADESVALMRSAPRGVLRIGAPAIFGSACLAPALPDYLAANPEVRVEMTLNNRVLDLLEEGYDAVIRTGALPDSGLIARSLAPYKLVACATPAYLARCGTPSRPEDLASHSCLGFHPGAAFDTWSFVGQDPDDDVIPVQVSGPMSANSGQALREAALGGVGIVLQAEALLLPDLISGRLVKVLEQYPPQALPLSVLYSPTRVITPKLRSFLDFLTVRF